jgi:hypothetical protein
MLVDHIAIAVRRGTVADHQATGAATRRRGEMRRFLTPKMDQRRHSRAFPRATVV